MAGTRAGGLAAKETNYRNHGPDFYRQIGAIGGKKGTTGGFYENRERARKAGAIGGLISRKGKVKLTSEQIEEIKKRGY